MRMRFVGLVSVVSLAACTGSIETDGGGDDQPPTDPAKDHVVAFSFVSPIGVMQKAKQKIYDGCITEELCAEQTVELMSVVIDRADVLNSTPMPGAQSFDVTALAPGVANVMVTAANTGVEATMATGIEVLAPTRFTLEPTAVFGRATEPKAVHIPRMCPAPIRFHTNARSMFSYKLYADQTALLGSGYYPFTSDQLTELAAADPTEDGGIVRYVAGANATDSQITSPIGDPIAITIVDNYDAILLSDAFKTPTGETAFWADVATGGNVICFDESTRIPATETPTVCSVVDDRDAQAKNIGAGPYQIKWLTPGTCRITFGVAGTDLTATKEYMPLP